MDQSEETKDSERGLGEPGSDSPSKQTLNWKKYLYNENLLTDALKFKHWDRSLEIPEKSTLIKDLTRTRNHEEFFRKEKTQKNLQLLATFYCQMNNVNYQQGMLELVIPFLLLRNKEFSLSKCYAYFNQFMNKYFPKVLQSKIVGQNKELAHALSAIQFSETLIKYHSAKCYSKILMMDGFELSLVITQWIMTLFAKGTSIPLVFLIFDKFMSRDNPNYIFYLTSALFELKEKEIELKSSQGFDELFQFLNKNMKDLKTEDDIEQWFQIADKHYQLTPSSFETLIAKTSFHEQTILSIEDVKELINIKTSVFSQYIFVFVSEILNILSEKSAKKFEFKLLDSRTDRPIKLNQIVNEKHVLKSKSDDFKNEKNMNKLAKKIVESISPNVHICLIGQSNQSNENSITMARILFSINRNYISILFGGVQELTKHSRKEGQKTQRQQSQECQFM